MGCSTNVEKTDIARDGERCDGGPISLGSSCCKDDDYKKCETSLCYDYGRNPDAKAMCPASYPFVYHDGDYCCSTNVEKEDKARDGERCDGGPISLGSSCCQNDDYKKCATALCNDFRGTPGATANCPASHPFVYHDGDYCCSTSIEKEDKARDGERCDGGPISLGSLCCQNDDYKKCPTALCNDYRGTPGATANCPASHPFVYHDGDYCCSTSI